VRIRRTFSGLFFLSRERGADPQPHHEQGEKDGPGGAGIPDPVPRRGTRTPCSSKGGHAPAVGLTT
jgi:hypothetical protein